MYARAVAVPVDPSKLDDMLQIWKESVLPAAQSQQGFKGALVLGDRATGQGMSITLWDSEGDMAAGESSGYYREQLAKFGKIFAGQPDLKHYEVFLHV
jgi:heme-degrading monooxygenase HmoA